MPFLKDTIIYENPDGSISITRIIDGGIPKGMDQDTYIMRVITKKARGRYNRVIDYQELKDVIRSHPNGHIDKIRLTPSKTFYIDDSIEVVDERMTRLKTSIRSKLRDGTALTQEESEFII